MWSVIFTVSTIVFIVLLIFTSLGKRFIFSSSGIFFCRYFTCSYRESREVWSLLSFGFDFH